MKHSASYSPDDNKLRIYPAYRLDAETYARVKAAGFSWAPKQELFVAPMWTPGREDLLLELCEEIGDEDTSLIDRAEERADRFVDYSDHRAQDAQSARKSVAAIADNIPLGQPILIGHHSEKHARRDAQRIENGMRRAVKMWETSVYWKQRAAGAIRSAKYKERPDVRARRIKKIEADKRKIERHHADTTKFLKMWGDLHDETAFRKKDGSPSTPRERALYISNFDHISQCFSLAEYPAPEGVHAYEGAQSLWSALDSGRITPEQAQDIAIPVHRRYLEHAARWLQHYENRLAYERAMLADAGGTISDRTGPEKGGACRCWASPGYGKGWSYIQKVNQVTVTVLDNWGNGGGNFKRTIPMDKLAAIMTAAQVQEARDRGCVRDTPDETGFYLFDAPTDAPTETRDEAKDRVHHEAVAARAAEGAEFQAMKESLRAGVQVVSAPQLFPTPPALATRMVELADIEPEHRVLEPSAGTGNILKAIYERAGAGVVGVEINPSLGGRLEAVNSAIVIGDFLACTAETLWGAFDRIVMNPPFENGSDIKHIQHALGMLKPGGRLVAICANGPRQQAALQPIADSWEVLPRDTFAGTSVSAVLLTATA